MKKKVTMFLVLGIVCSILSMWSYGIVTNQLIEIPANQEWKFAGTDTRSGAWTEARAQCHSVFPTSGSDNFKKIQVRIKNESGTCLMSEDYVVLTEGAGNELLEIKNGLLRVQTVSFEFRGNSNSAARAIVSYSGE